MKDLIQFVENLIERKINNDSVYFSAFEHHKNKNYEDERLEYLGDAVLELTISDFLFKKFPNEREGGLTVMRSKITNRKFLNNVALKLKLDEFIDIDGQNNQIKHLYGCVLEAFIGALYIDLGYETSKELILNKIIFPYVDFSDFEHKSENHKGTLLEYFQKNKKKVEFLTYQIDDPNAVLFESRIVIDGILNKTVEIANSKKDAEQNLSKKILDSVFIKNF